MQCLVFRCTYCKQEEGAATEHSPSANNSLKPPARFKRNGFHSTRITAPRLMATCQNIGLARVHSAFPLHSFHYRLSWAGNCRVDIVRKDARPDRRSLSSFKDKEKKKSRRFAVSSIPNRAHAPYATHSSPLLVPVTQSLSY